MKANMHTFMITSRSVLLRIKNVSDESFRGNQNTRQILFFENRVIYEQMRKNIVEQTQGTNDRMVNAHCMLDN
jgi:hypothetical protein